MGLIDKLLKQDTAALTNRPTAEVEIERLSKLIGEPCIIKVQALSTKQMREIKDFNTREEWREVQRDGKKVKEKVKITDNYKLGLEAIVAGTIDPDFKDSRLREKFKTEVPGDIVEEMFLPGEIKKISDKISELSGVGQEGQSEIDEEIKN